MFRFDRAKFERVIRNRPRIDRCLRGVPYGQFCYSRALRVVPPVLQVYARGYDSLTFHAHAYGKKTQFFVKISWFNGYRVSIFYEWSQSVTPAHYLQPKYKKIYIYFLTITLQTLWSFFFNKGSRCNDVTLLYALFFLYILIDVL